MHESNAAHIVVHRASRLEPLGEEGYVGSYCGDLWLDYAVSIVVAKIPEAVRLALVVGISAGAKGLGSEVLMVLAELLPGGVVWKELSM